MTFKYKTLTQAEWRKAHKQHGEIERDYCCVQPPESLGYKLFRLVCACGQRFIGMEVLVKPEPKRHHPHCIWCEGKEHCLHPTMNEERPEPYLQCRHCGYSREMTEQEADADWEECDFE